MASAKPNMLMQALTPAMNSGAAQSRGEVFHRPRQQDYYYPSQDGGWLPTSTTQRPSVIYSRPPINPKIIRLVSWNIDMLVPFAEERMIAALKYLNKLVSTAAADVPLVVFLQEMGQSDLEQIRDSRWINERFNITDIDGRHWLSPYYGTTTLIDRRLKIKNIFRVPWISKFDRDGLFIDIALASPESSKEDGKILRLCNTHLESLVADPPVRPLQLSAASSYLHDNSVACALLAGDLNAIEAFDRSLHSENNLHDTYLQLGGHEDSEEGYTWGHQVPQWMREKFGRSRMDKILFRGHIDPKRFERFGMGVMVDEKHMQLYKDLEDPGWVTDHYGVMGDFEFTGDWELDTWSEGPSRARSKLT